MTSPVAAHERAIAQSSSGAETKQAGGQKKIETDVSFTCERDRLGAYCRASPVPGCQQKGEWREAANGGGRGPISGREEKPIGFLTTQSWSGGPRLAG